MNAVVEFIAANWLGFWVALGSAMHVLSFLLVCVHCLRNRREATSSILWIFVSWSFPVVGPLFYLAVGIDRVPDKGFKKQVRNQLLLAERRAREEESLPLAYWLAVHKTQPAEPADSFGAELNRAMSPLLPEYPLLGGNRIDPLVTGDEAFPAMFDAVERAADHIHMQSFIIANDVVGRRLMELLVKKAKEGVKIRLMYDRFGSTQAFLTGLFRRCARLPNMQIQGWTQANPLKRQFQINLRNHRKIMVVDGRHAFCGGINFHAENTARNSTPAIRDYHFSIKGPIVQELQYTFIRDWYFMTEEDPGELLTTEYFPHLSTQGSAMIRLVNGEPTSDLEAIADMFFMAIVSARKQILAVTPYFVPPPYLVRALRLAALRGVDVRLLVPRMSNHIYTSMAGMALYDELLASGVRIFQRSPPFIHAKALIADDVFALVGTANMDVRSLKLNYETNMAVYDEDFVDRLKRIVLDDLARSEELNLIQWRARPVWRRMAENFCALMTPVL